MFFSNVFRKFRFRNPFRISNEEEKTGSTSSKIPLLPSPNGKCGSQTGVAFHFKECLSSEIEFGSLGFVF